MSKSDDLPPCRLILRGKLATEIFTSVNNGSDLVPAKTLVTDACPFYERSKHGERLAILHPGKGLEIVKELTSDESIFLEGSTNVQNVCFSPLSTYILTWERNAGLKIWSSANGKFLKQLNLKMIRRESWPNVQWTHDEKYMFHIVTNEIQVYDVEGKDLTEVLPTFKFRCEGITSFSLSPAAAEPGLYHFTSFVPEKKGKPARASAHAFDPLNLRSSDTFSIACSKSIFQAEDCTIKWSPSGHAAIALTHTSVDTSGDSYYGSTGLYLLHMSASEPEPVVNVPLAKEGPVLDVSWSPDESKPCFAVLSGKMPAQGCLHHGSSADPLFLFGEAHRNTISWSPHGRFLCLAGFGNLAGGMDFWDRNKLKKMNSEPVTAVRTVVGYDWSPDSRLFLVSTTAPRMNVDNGIAIYKYNGDGPLMTKDSGTLYQANWIPSIKSVYPDRPATPVKKKKNDSASNAASSAPAKPTPVGRYIPPSARGRQGAGMSLADRMRAEKEAKMASSGAPRKITKAEGARMAGAASGKNIPVGMTVQTPALEKEMKAKKAAEKKEKARLKKEAEEAAKKKAEEDEAIAKIKAQEALEEANRNDPVKRAKKINKILKQIEGLKEKDPSSLNDDQQAKLKQEDELRAELATLNI